MAEAILKGALARDESRGAHYKPQFPNRDDPNFLKATIAYYKSLGITVARVMTDNRSCYKVFKFRDTCRKLDLKHIRTKPYTPKTNSLPPRRRGARPSALSRPPCASGPMSRPTNLTTPARCATRLAASLQLASPA